MNTVEDESLTQLRSQVQSLTARNAALEGVLGRIAASRKGVPPAQIASLIDSDVAVRDRRIKELEAALAAIVHEPTDFMAHLGALAALNATAW